MMGNTVHFRLASEGEDGHTLATLSDVTYVPRVGESVYLSSKFAKDGRFGYFDVVAVISAYTTPDIVTSTGDLGVNVMVKPCVVDPFEKVKEAR